MNNYFRVLSRLANTPLYISEDKLNILSTNVIIPLLTSGKAFENSGFQPTVKEVSNKDPKIAIINVFDSLVSKGGAGESGFTSYQGIKNSILHSIAEGATKLGFYIDSPGGEASGIFALTDFINSIPSIYGVETFSFTDGSATSAAYAIASSTQRIYATELSKTGSIAAVTSLVDITESDKKAGYSFTILRSKDEKALYNPHEKLTQEVISKAQQDLQYLDTLFNNAVNKYRPSVSVETIKSLKGDSFFAEKALEFGLIDSIVSSIDEVIQIESETMKSSKTSLTKRGNKMATLEELNTQISALVAENSTLKESVANAVTKAVEQERIRCSEIFKAGVELKVSSDLISKRLSAGSSKEDSLDIFTAVAEAQASFTAIDTSTASSSTVDLSSKEQEIRFKLGEGFEATASAILAAAKGVK